MTTTINASTSTGLVQTADTSGSLALQTAGTTAVTIDTSQNVGIGTTSPSTYSAKLAVVASSGVANQWLVGGASSGAYAYFSNNAQSSTANTMQVGQGWASGSDNIGFLNTNGANPMLFATNGAERMRISSGGTVYIKCTADPSASVFGSAFINNGVGAAVLYQSTSITSANALQVFYNPNGNVGSVGTSGSNAYYSTTSDYRLKENIVPMTGALEKVTQLKPVNYKWKADGSDGEGFIAHELAEVCPHAVVGDKDAVDADGNPIYQSIDTSFLVGVLTKAIQELKAINDTQAETLSQQATLINALTARIEALENK